MRQTETLREIFSRGRAIAQRGDGKALVFSKARVKECLFYWVLNGRVKVRLDESEGVRRINCKIHVVARPKRIGLREPVAKTLKPFAFVQSWLLCC
jgi:hypothetical protein